jgi:hypothetical protein
MGTILLMDDVAFRLGSRYYPFILNKRIHNDGEATYIIEMKVGKHDVIVTDAPSLEGVLIRHKELINYAFAARNLQGRTIKR